MVFVLRGCGGSGDYDYDGTCGGDISGGLCGAGDVCGSGVVIGGGVHGGDNDDDNNVEVTFFFS